MNELIKEIRRLEKLYKKYKHQDKEKAREVQVRIDSLCSKLQVAN